MTAEDLADLWEELKEADDGAVDDLLFKARSAMSKYDDSCSKGVDKIKELVEERGGLSEEELEALIDKFTDESMPC